jgi:hypothetical protein
LTGNGSNWKTLDCQDQAHLPALAVQPAHRRDAWTLWENNGLLFSWHLAQFMSIPCVTLYIVNQLKNSVTNGLDY